MAFGCVHNPILDECYTAARGGGAFLNGQPIRCGDTAELSESLLATGFHYRLESQPDSNLQHFVDLATRVRGIRRLGAAACDLCYVADGRFDGLWEPWLEAWDVAAGSLIAREAGCAVTDFDGGDDWLFGRRIVAANPRLAPQIRDALAATDADRLPGPAWDGGAAR
jgi:myo-inositol-1(or 4)-monophosphatase